ncbi:MAG: 30S ribosomal protein S7 [Chlamydiia bacterium]
MSRRRRATKRTVEADPVYNSILVTKFINRLMIGGKKSVARTIVYGAIELFSQRVKAEHPLEAFETAIENCKPQLEVKSRRVGGATYQVPVEIAPDRRLGMACKWIINFSRAKAGKPMLEALAGELSDCFNNQGSSVKKKEDMHRMAEANKAFAHFKW